MDIEFCEGSIALLEKIVRINYDIFNGMYETETYSFEHYQEKLKNVKPVIYLAKSNNAIMGDVISFQKNKSLYVWILGVAKEFRNKGIASNLLNLTEKYAKQNNFDSVTIKVYKISQEMLDLMKTRNYQITKVETHTTNDKYTAIHLSLNLTKVKS